MFCCLFIVCNKICLLYIKTYIHIQNIYLTVMPICTLEGDCSLLFDSPSFSLCCCCLHTQDKIRCLAMVSHPMFQCVTQAVWATPDPICSEISETSALLLCCASENNSPQARLTGYHLDKNSAPPLSLTVGQFQIAVSVSTLWCQLSAVHHRGLKLQPSAKSKITWKYRWYLVKSG